MAAGPHRRRDHGDTQPLIGRKHELEQLRAAFAHSSKGQGELVLISGEAGIGKTTLTRVFTDGLAPRDAVVLHGHCYDFSTTPPYGLWLDMADRYRRSTDLPEFPALLRRGSDTQKLSSPFVVFEAAQDFFLELASQRPVVIVLEDLHWADQASLELLRYLAQRLEGTCLIIATYRSDELNRHHSLFQLLPAIVREAGATRIELSTLDRDDILTMIRSRWELSPADEARLLDHLLTYAEGNPFFTVEVLRTLEQSGRLHEYGNAWTLGDISSAPVPSLVQQVIESRLARLGEESRHFLEIASVIGHEVRLDVWQAVAGMTGDELLHVLNQALDLHILEQSPDGGSVRFDHALTRETLYRNILTPRLRTWSRLIAETLIDARDASPDTIAYHFQKAADPRAVEWLIRAGLNARRTAAWVSASHSFSEAASIMQELDQNPRIRGWLLFYAAYLLRFSQTPVLSDFLVEAERVAREIDDPAMAAYIEYHRGASACIGGDVRRGMPMLEQGVDTLEQLFGSRVVPRTDDQAIAVISSYLSEPPVTEAPEAPHIAEASVERYTSTQRGVIVNWLSQSGRYREALAMGERFTTNMKAIYGDRYLDFSQIASGQLGLASAYCAVCRAEDARSLFANVRESFLSLDEFAMVAFACWTELKLCHIPFFPERTQEREQLISQARSAWRNSSGAMSDAHSMSTAEVQLSYITGQWTDALQGMGTLEMLRVLSQSSFARVTLGSIARYRGQNEEAWKYIAGLLPEGPETKPGDGYFPNQLTAQSLAIDLSLTSGDLERARRWLEAHDVWLQWSGAESWRPENLLHWARYSHLAGDIREAHDLAEQSLALAQGPIQPVTLIDVHRFMGKLARESGDLENTEAHLESSLERARACEMPFPEALTRLEFAELELGRANLDAARHHIAAVREICTPLQAYPALQRADVLDPDSGSRARDLGFGLTGRELDVLRLVTQGKSDKEIADELFVSPHTVRRHVSSVLRKLDVSSRTAAASLAMRNDLV